MSPEGLAWILPELAPVITGHQVARVLKLNSRPAVMPPIQETACGPLLPAPGRKEELH